jgi:hypothetical protein
VNIIDDKNKKFPDLVPGVDETLFSDDRKKIKAKILEIKSDIFKQF